MSLRRIAPVLTAVVVAALTGCSAQTMGAPKGDLMLTATFDDVQSLVVGHGVQLADVRIGTVTDVGLDGYRAKVTMSIEDGRSIPVGTAAVVSQTSLLGENYVELMPPPALTAGPYLRSGDQISKTSSQPNLEQISGRLGPVLAAVAGQDMERFIDAAATGVAGKGEQLNRMIAAAARVSDSYAAAAQDLTAAIDGLGRLGDTLAGSAAEFDKLPAHLLLAAERAQADRAELKRAIVELTDLARSFTGTVKPRHGERLQTLLQRADALASSVLRGKEELVAMTRGIEQLLSQPHITHDGQAMLYAWMAGLLPPTMPGAAPPGSQPAAFPTGPEYLTELLDPR